MQIMNIFANFRKILVICSVNAYKRIDTSYLFTTLHFWK